MKALLSEHLEKAVEELSKLPGIGKKTALRLILHLLKQDEQYAITLSKAIEDVRLKTHRCKICNNISDNEICNICADSNRNHKQICIVEDVSSLISIENTGKYKGVYHVLGGKISPMENIGPDKLTLNLLLKRLEEDEPEEIIFALGTTMEADVTTMYIFDMIKDYKNLKITTIARGISFGDDLEDTDVITLGKSIELRTEMETETSK
jgi:recombination protein RecR